MFGWTRAAPVLSRSSVGALVHRLGDDVFIEERSGLRCVFVETCKRVGG
jgi:hypothetical protein